MGDPLKSSERDIETKINKRKQVTMNANKFIKKNPGFGINSFKISDLENIVVTEYAPEIFKHIRSKIISEKDVFESFIPSDNYAAMANF